MTGLLIDPLGTSAILTVLHRIIMKKIEIFQKEAWGTLVVPLVVPIARESQMSGSIRSQQMLSEGISG